MTAMTTQQTEEALVATVRHIRGLWPLVLMDTKGLSNGPAGSDAVTGSDRRQSLLYEAASELNGWARLIMEDRGVEPIERCEHGQRQTMRWPYVGPLRTPECVAGIPWNGGRGYHRIGGYDGPALCKFIERHAQWFSGHEAAWDALEELRDREAEMRAVALPSSRDWLVIGECPFVVASDGNSLDGTMVKSCKGVIRGYANGDRDPHCTHCKQTAVVEWWEDVLAAALPEWATAGELVRIVHRQFGRPVKAVTIRKWVERQILAPGEIRDGETFYEVRDVVWRLAKRWEQKSA